MTRHLSKKRANLKGKKHTKKQKGGFGFSDNNAGDYLNISTYPNYLAAASKIKPEENHVDPHSMETKRKKDNNADTIYGSVVNNKHPKAVTRSVTRSVPDTKFTEQEYKVSQTQSIDEAFEKLDKPTKDISKAQNPDVKHKNRYVNILPYDHNIVTLSGNEPKFQYINASWIPGYPDIKDYQKKQKRNKYIATQGPTPLTVGDFWRMIWEKKIKVIAMVTNAEEKGRPKSFKYWTDTTEKNKYISYISENEHESHTFHVTTKPTTNYSFPSFLIRTIKLTYNGESRNIYQFQYVGLPDHGVPKNIEEYLRFVIFVRQVAKSLNSQIVIHCSAGVGRTGIFLITDMMLSIIQNKHNLMYSDHTIFNIINKLRLYRTSAVQTEEQYQLLVEIRALFSTSNGRSLLNQLSINAVSSLNSIGLYTKPLKLEERITNKMDNENDSNYEDVDKNPFANVVKGVAQSTKKLLNQSKKTSNKAARKEQKAAEKQRKADEKAKEAEKKKKEKKKEKKSKKKNKTNNTNPKKTKRRRCGLFDIKCRQERKAEEATRTPRAPPVPPRAPRVSRAPPVPPRASTASTAAAVPPRTHKQRLSEIEIIKYQNEIKRGNHPEASFNNMTRADNARKKLEMYGIKILNPQGETGNDNGNF